MWKKNRQKQIFSTTINSLQKMCFVGLTVREKTKSKPKNYTKLHFISDINV